MSGYMDAVFVLSLAMVMMAVLDWRIARAFSRHEKVEAQNIASIMLAAEGAAAAAREHARNIRELRADGDAARSVVASLSDEVRMHDRRLGAVEERLMRTALSIPHREVKP